MVQIRTMHKDDIDPVSMLISELNNNEESHIGYCGKDMHEIANSFIKEITDIKYTDSFVVAYEKGELVGVLGFDAYFENNSVEIWGPFMKENKWDDVFRLWDEMLILLPSDIDTIGMFPNKNNLRLQRFAKELGFTQQSEQTILTFSRDDRTKLRDAPIVDLTEEYFSEMKQLHDQVFPNTYYNGQQIIDRLNKDRKVFIIKDSIHISGYIYIEAEPEFGEASIEFIAVKESEQGKGLGTKLISVALKWLFTYEEMTSITLCVNSNNKNAICLYKKVGFKQLHDLVFFQKKHMKDK
ncbi:GNAT family N-acetyltransferase [Pseudalkalibacillus berkeleyi]|uniref:GNAT family N-acetyltransferase n=1 Tax=Pseudalkalibacillus berkeleyi TaxID=1069813 RepID=A0ABS9H1H9_9BACL|nr:GNAT family N-acetyltransferase [Pseudalkalibacillus berkeleyi]MCF6137688.1 GNAT family N-acetyltransferase [Pseudalkalibacillus berkeleyi]